MVVIANQHGDFKISNNESFNKQTYFSLPFVLAAAIKKELSNRRWAGGDVVTTTTPWETKTMTTTPLPLALNGRCAT